MAEQDDHEFLKQVRSFRFAFAGWWYVLRTQRNAWIHATATFFVFALGLWLKLPRIDWAVLILTVTLVWMAEFFNTALEVLVDLSMPESHPLAKVAKDVGAGAVLVCACASVLVGLLILGPPLWQRLGG